MGTDAARGFQREEGHEVSGDEALLALSLTELASAVRSRGVSPVEVTRALLCRLESVNGLLGTYVKVVPERALAAAKRAEKEAAAGRFRGPLHGVPLGLKDVICTAGLRTAMGSALFKDHVPDRDAAIVGRLKRAGAVIVGKTHTQELALGPTGDVSYFGPARNPHDPARITGGSSSGSAAAVAAGLAFGAVGTDAGGSIRIPAACCGVVGTKPTFSLVSRRGVFPPDFSLDHVGPITRTVEDNALLLGALAGHDPRDPHSARRRREDFGRRLDEGVSGCAVAVPSLADFGALDEEIEAIFLGVLEALRSLGASVVRVTLAGAGRMADAQRVIVESEAYSAYGGLLEERTELFSEEVASRLRGAASIPAHEYLRAQRTRAWAGREMRRALGGAEVLVTPSLPVLPKEIGARSVRVRGQDEDIRAALTRYMKPANMCGFPALSVPCGFSESGLPVGAQLIGRPFDEANLFRFARAIELRQGPALPVTTLRPRGRGLDG